MDQTDERHLFDLIVNPAISVLTSIATPAALFLCTLSIYQGKYLYLIPFGTLIVLGGLDLVLFMMRFLVANVARKNSNFNHRPAFYLLVLTLLLSVTVILCVLSSGV